MKPALILEEDQSFRDKPILIVDKKGVLGSSLAVALSKDLLVVLVSGKTSGLDNSSNIIYVPYHKNFPVIPDNTYSYIILFGNDPAVNKSIKRFIKKAEEDNSPLIYINYFLTLNDETKNDIAEYKKTKIILYGDIFGNRQDLLLESKVNSFLREAKERSRIEIPAEGLEKIYPVQFEDLTGGFIKGIFGLGKSKNFYLFPKYPITLISLAHLIQKKDPNIQIDLKPTKKAINEKEFFLEDVEYLLTDDYPYQEKIKAMDIEEKEIDYAEKKSVKEERYREKENLFRKIWYPSFLIIFFLLLPFLSTLIFSILGLYQLNSAKSSLEKGDLKSSQVSILSSANLFNLSQVSLKTLTLELKIIGKENSIDTFSRNIESGKKISEAVFYAISSSDLLKRVLDGHSRDPNEDIVSEANMLKQSLIILKELESQNNISPGLSKKLEPYHNLISQIFNIQEAFPLIFDGEGKKKFLVLFQNNMELRPGGGFIGSYGILSLDKGKIEDFSIHDVYDADGQLKGHVEPPYPIRRYIPLVHWYLRDSNFNLDFPSAASSSAFLFYQETGETVDGVIGIDVSFVKNLVSALGPVYVPEYKETVKADNFFYLTETHAEKNSFPSSTQKKDFLTFLYKAINNEILTRKNLPYLSILKSISDSILEKHIIFTFANPEIQKTFSINGLSSSIWDERTQGEPSVNDFVGVNEANLGVNKANYFIGRSVSYKVQLKEDGTILSKLSLSLKNDSTKWPGGDYKNYIRFIFPKGSILDRVIIDGVSQKIVKAVTDPLIYEAKNFIPPDGLEVEKTEEGNKTIYGFLAIVPSGKLKKIEIEYTLPWKIDPNASSMAYDLKIFKQPGTGEYPFDFIFSYPPAFRVLSKNPDLKDQDGNEIYQKNLNQDERIQINLTQK